MPERLERHVVSVLQRTGMHRPPAALELMHLAGVARTRVVSAVSPAGLVDAWEILTRRDAKHRGKESA